MIPWLYHTHHSLNTEDIDFWLRLADQYPKPVLELGCGTGRVAMRLAEAGNEVIGIDKDYEMLAFLRRIFPFDEHSRLQLIQANFADPVFTNRFGLVIMPCNTYSTLSDQTRLKTLENVKRYLIQDGLFVVSLPNPFLLKSLPANGESEIEEIINHPTTGHPIQVSSAWERDSQYFSVSWHYDELQSEGRVKRISLVVKHNLLSATAYFDEITSSGLAVVQILGDFDRSGFSTESPHLIILAAHAQR